MTTYAPQQITAELIRKLAKTPPPDRPREVLDKTHGMILRHQPSGYLGLYVQLGRGKREKLGDARRIIDPNSTRTIAEARAVARRKKVEHTDGRDFAGERKAERAIPTLSAFIHDTYAPWAKQNRRSGEATVARLKACFEEDFGKLKLDRIRQADLDSWISRRRKEEVKAETINRDIDALRAALSRAVRLGIVKENALLGVERPETDRHKQVVRALTAAEKAKLLAALGARDDKKREERASANQWRDARGQEPLPSIGRFADVLTPAIITSLETGLRRGELFALEWRSIDLEDKTLRVHAATAKTFETRDTPLNETAYKTLRDWWLQRGQPKAGLVFTLDGEPIGNLKRSYHAVLQSAGIERENRRGERVNWHSLRHTFGSLLGAAGVDPTTLMKLMGHANLSTTQRYLHTDADRKRAAVELLGPSASAAASAK